MILLDSSIIIASFRQNELKHKDAIDIIKNSWKILIIDFILSEILTVLKMRESHEITISCLDFLRNNSDIEISRVTDIEFNLTISLFEQNNNKLSFVDLLLVVVKHQRDLKIATFDKELVKVLLENKLWKF